MFHLTLKTSAQCTGEGDDDDEVVHELDVYVTRSLGKLLLAQYPLRPTYKPYQTALRECLRVRPVQHELEMDMKLQTNPNKPTQVRHIVISKLSLHLDSILVYIVVFFII